MRQLYILTAVVVVLLGGVALFTNQISQSQETTVVSEPSEMPTQMTDSKNIVEVALSDPQFSTLVKAVQTAGLVETLSGEGPFTVFAPTNEAFAKVPKETLEAILNDKEQLTNILTYHVVAGEVKAADVVKLHSAKTVQGGEIEVNVNGNVVSVDNAKVTQTDIEASNGVIHVIDTVLIPR